MGWAVLLCTLCILFVLLLERTRTCPRPRPPNLHMTRAPSCGGHPLGNADATSKSTARLLIIHKEIKILVLYAFHVYNERVEYFIRHALFKDPMFDFVVICNDLTTAIAVPDYVSLLKRKNTGYDFGAWSEGLLGNDRYTAYDYFVFVNSSVIGPYLPDGYTKPWPYRLIDGLQGNTRLFGSTINTLGDPVNHSHVQSFAYAMDREALEYLMSSDIFSLTKWAQTFNDAIWLHEVRMSRLIISRGWNIGSLMHHYADVDFTFTSRDPASYGVTWLGDVMYPQYGLDRKEVMFLKGNRGFHINHEA